MDRRCRGQLPPRACALRAALQALGSDATGAAPLGQATTGQGPAPPPPASPERAERDDWLVRHAAEAVAASVVAEADEEATQRKHSWDAPAGRASGDGVLGFVEATHGAV